MSSHAARATRWSLTLGVAALAACSDQQEPTAIPRGLTPRLGVGAVLTVTNTSGGTILGSLRWALNLSTGGEIIRFDPSLAGATIVVDSSALIRHPITIEGPTDKGITISGGGKTTVFFGNYDGTATLRNLTISNGFMTEGGFAAGIHAVGDSLVLDHVTLTNNHASGYAAIVTTNLTLINSTVSGNTSTSGNRAVWGATSVRLVNSTVAYNTGGAINVDGGKAVFENSIITNNGSNSCFARFGITYQGKNLSDDTTCGNIDQIIIGDAKLYALADNGGPSATHALQPASPALNAGTSCAVTVDQRYAPRDAQCDLGSYEFLDFTKVTLTIDPAGAVNQANGWAVLSGTVQCSRDDKFDLSVTLHQQQKSGRDETDVQGVRSVPVDCSTTPRPWTAAVVLSDGQQFQAGSGQATVETSNTPRWVAYNSASGSVRLFWARK